MIHILKSLNLTAVLEKKNEKCLNEKFCNQILRLFPLS